MNKGHIQAERAIKEAKPTRYLMPSGQVVTVQADGSLHIIHDALTSKGATLLP